MWIKTQGHYLLNLDSVDYIDFDGDYTYAKCFESMRVHLLGEGNLLDKIYENIARGMTIMEVR